MRKILSRLFVFCLVGLLVSGPAAMAFPSTGLASPLPVYTPEIIGDRFRNEAATADKILLPDTPLEGAALRGTGSGTLGTLSVGQQKYFLIRTRTGYSVTTFTLRGIGTYGEVWVQNNLNFPSADPRNPVTVTDDQVNYLIEQFDTVIYPKESEFFATPDSHTGEGALLAAMLGLPSDYYVSDDGIERVIILVSNVRDENYYDPGYPLYIAGFFSSAFETYFDRNVITVDAYDWANRVGPNTSPWRPADGTGNDRPYLYEGVFAHEYQHLLHSDIDSDEENWINEGMADFAAYITGYSNPDTDSHVNAYMDHPYNSLVNWGDQGALENLADYGAAYLMQLYLAQNYGSSFTQALAHNPLNGIASVNDTLAKMRIPRTFEDIYNDWVITNLINGKKAGPAYAYKGVNLRVDLDDNEGDYGPAALPWGPAYYQIPAKPKISNLIIDGISFLPNPWTVVDDPLAAGNKVLYSGTGDLLDNFLILPLDLTGKTGTVLSFKTLYDIEQLWDFGFVQVSVDDGNTWQSIPNANTVGGHDASAHPDIVANLPGLTGYSGGWVDQTFDLSAYDGREVLLAFRYMTDWASAGNAELAQPGWYIDDLSVAGVTCDGSSLDPFMGIDEVRGQFTQYDISFVGRKASGAATWKVLNLDMQTFDEAQAVELQKFLRDSSLDEIIMIVTQAAPQGSAVPAPFEYSVMRRAEVSAPKK